MSESRLILFRVAGKSPIKKAAVEDLVLHLNTNHYELLTGYSAVPGATSGVAEQPVGEHEILRGAINRALSSYQLDSSGDVYLAMENGIEFNEAQSTWMDYAIVLGYAPRYGQFSYVKSAALRFPTWAVEETRNKEGGFELNTVGKTLWEKGIVKDHADPQTDLIGISRQFILFQALKELVHYLPQGLFLPHLKPPK